MLCSLASSDVARRDFAHFQIRQRSFLVSKFHRGIVRAFDVRPQVAGEIDRFAAHLEYATFAFDRNDNPSTACVGHLAGDGAFPNQIEEPELIIIQHATHRFGQFERMARRADRFVSFLGILDFGFVNPRFGG